MALTTIKDLMSRKRVSWVRGGGKKEPLEGRQHETHPFFFSLLSANECPFLRNEKKGKKYDPSRVFVTFRKSPSRCVPLQQDGKMGMKQSSQRQLVMMKTSRCLFLLFHLFSFFTPLRCVMKGTKEKDAHRFIWPWSDRPPTTFRGDGSRDEQAVPCPPRVEEPVELRLTIRHWLPV